MNSKIIMPLFLASIMIFSILGFAFSSNDTSGRIDFNGYKFAQTNSGFLTYKDNQQIVISSDPRSLDLTTLPEISINDLNTATKIYLSFNPEENLPQYLSYFNFNVKTKLKNLIPACSEDVEGCGDIPIKSCEDASLLDRVIQLKYSEIPTITYNSGCLLIQGNPATLQQQLDALTLKLLL
jgi:hypothetical protein